MAYELPVEGELDWHIKLNASIEAVKATADAAETPTGAQTKAETEADEAVTAHVAAADPHGDRAYADDAFVRAGRAQAAFVSAFETTTSTTPTALTTAGPAVTTTVPASGQVMVIVQSWARNSTVGSQVYLSFAASGANTQAASLDYAAVWDQDSADYSTITATFVLTGLAAGSTTFTTQYWAEGGTATFGRRRITVIPI